MSFGAEYGITVDSKLGCYTKVTVRVPMYRGVPERTDEPGRQVGQENKE